MQNIFESASKIVFILLAVTACVAFLYGAFTPVETDGLPIDQFMILTAGAFAFYFSNKGDPTKDYAGK